MTDQLAVPSWVPDHLHAHWAEDEGLRLPRGGEYTLGAIPEGVDVRVTLPTSGAVVLRAGPVDVGSKLVLRGHQSVPVTVDGFRVIHLVGTAPRSLHVPASVNLHVMAGGSLSLQSVGDTTSTAKVWFKDGDTPSDITVTTSVPFTSVSGETTGAVDLRAHGGTENCPVAPGTTVRLPKCRSLTLQSALERCDLQIGGRLLVTGGLVGVCNVVAGAVNLGPDSGPRAWAPGDQVLVGAGCTVRARSGDLSVVGQLEGTQESPATLVGAADQEVRVGTIRHASIHPDAGERLGAVTVGSCVHVEVGGATSVKDQGADSKGHHEATMMASARIALTKPVHGGSLEAGEIRVRDVVGPARLEGDTVVLATSAHDEGNTVTVEASTWIKAATPADLHLATDNVDGCAVVVSQGAVHPSRYDQPVAAPPDDLMADEVADLGPESGRAALLALHGPLRVQSLADNTVVKAASGVTQLHAAGAVRLDTGASVRQLRTTAKLEVANDSTLDATDVRAREIVGGHLDASGTVAAQTMELQSLGCGDLQTHGDAVLGSLLATQGASVGGRLIRLADVPDDGTFAARGEIALADVEVPLELNKAKGRIRSRPVADRGEATVAPLISKLTWRDPIGDLELAHAVSVLHVISPDHPRVLDLPEPATCERIEIAGQLVLKSQSAGQEGTDPEEDSTPQAVLHDGSKLTLRSAHPVWLQPKADAKARLEAANPGTVLHMSEEATSGTLALAVPNIDGTQTPVVLRAAPSESGAAPPQQSTIVVERGRLSLHGPFRDVLVKQQGARTTTLDIPQDTVVHQMRGETALGMFRGRVTGAAADHGRLYRFVSPDGPPWSRAEKLARRFGGPLLAAPSRDDRLVLRDPPVRSKDEPAVNGVLVMADVTRLSFAELDRLKALDVFSPDPVALEKQARARSRDDAAKQANAQHLSHIAELVEGRSVTGSVRSMANWAASTAHAAAGRGWERAGRWIARLLGFGQRPLPPAALLVALVTLLTLVLSATSLEADVCRAWFDDEVGARAVGGYDRSGGHIAGYTWVQHLERVLLSPLAFLRVAGTPSLEPLGCNALLQVAGTILVALPLAFVLIGLRNYLRSPVDR